MSHGHRRSLPFRVVTCSSLWTLAYLNLPTSTLGLLDWTPPAASIVGVEVFHPPLKAVVLSPVGDLRDSPLLSSCMRIDLILANTFVLSFLEVVAALFGGERPPVLIWMRLCFWRYISKSTNTFEVRRSWPRDCGRAFLALVECAENLASMSLRPAAWCRGVFELEPIPRSNTFLLARRIVLDVTRHLLSSTGIATENRGHLLRTVMSHLSLRFCKFNITILPNSSRCIPQGQRGHNDQQERKQFVPFCGGEHECWRRKSKSKVMSWWSTELKLFSLGLMADKAMGSSGELACLVEPDHYFLGDDLLQQQTLDQLRHWADARAVYLQETLGCFTSRNLGDIRSQTRWWSDGSRLGRHKVANYCFGKVSLAATLGCDEQHMRQHVGCFKVIQVEV